ncbi:peptidyl-prolyl cis-trans isomerase [Cohnella hongkongensis]|uniref:peptidylprolyl isomerase n=1 Tax=Cohnella hongkongensis TaxID=178337 RepID=A0ABV9FF64_9BACL
MRETIRHLPPLVLMALLATLMIASGCTKDDQGIVSEDREPSKSAAGGDDAVATVGQSTITRQQLLERLLASYGSQTLRSMMLAKAVSEEAAAAGIEVTDEELEQEIRSISQGYEDEAEFYRSMEEQLGMSREDVREDARYRLLLEKLTTYRVQVSPEEVERYLEEHWAEYQPLRKYRLSKIVVQTEELGRGLMEKLGQGDDFAELARTYSIDEFTSDQGGEAGWIESNDPFEAASVLEQASRMGIGDVAGPLPTDQGFAIIRLEGVSEEKIRSDEDIRLEARRQVALSKSVPAGEMERALLEKHRAVVLDRSLAP